MAAIIFLALGALMLYFAVEIGMRRRIAFLHDYHYQGRGYHTLSASDGSGACCCGDVLCQLCSDSVVPKGAFSAGVVWRSASGNRSYAICSVSL